MRVQVVAAVVLLRLGGLLILGNWLEFSKARRTGLGFSCVPILGGLFGCIGFLLLPKLRVFAFIAPLADLGCVPMLVALALHLVRSIFDRSLV